MKEVTMTDDQKQEKKRYEGRLSYYVNKLGMSHADAVARATANKGVDKPVNNGSAEGVSEWKKRQLEKKAREDATKAHPLLLDKCPSCGAEYFRKLGDKYEPIKMDNCVPCSMRFYYYMGMKA